MQLVDDEDSTKELHWTKIELYCMRHCQSHTVFLIQYSSMLETCHSPADFRVPHSIHVVLCAYEQTGASKTTKKVTGSK